MADFTNSKSSAGFSLKLWRGERMALIGMDVAKPEPDFVGFSIEVLGPGDQDFTPLGNRLNFSYGQQAPVDAVTGAKAYPSTEAPFQKFRWVHFPDDPQGGVYQYRVTKQHMKSDGVLTAATSITLGISLDTAIYDGLEVGFTRNFASSQAYAERYKNNPDIIPDVTASGLDFKKVSGDVYEWLGFEGRQLIFDFLQEVAKDHSLTLDCFAYDFNEPDILAFLQKIGPRLRMIIDNSKGHDTDDCDESRAEGLLKKTAGDDNIKRMHFSGLQHNKVLIAKDKTGQATKVLFGSTNFSFRGLYIQANNALVFHNPAVAAMFEDVFQLAFDDPKKFSAQPIATAWHPLPASAKPKAQFCFSPHQDPALSLGPIGDAIDNATSSVLFSIAFLNQAKTGAVRESIDRLADKSVFSYGISDKAGGLKVEKPDGSVGIVDFSFLAKHTPKPFDSEWSGGAGIHEHHKFVVTDFNLPTAKVFTGSSNLSVGGESKNGDNLVMIEDQRVATSYAIEALRVFDHLHFRSTMQAAKTDASVTLTLDKPQAISGKPAWFERFYVDDSEAAADRKLFSH